MLAGSIKHPQNNGRFYSAINIFFRFFDGGKITKAPAATGRLYFLHQLLKITAENKGQRWGATQTVGGAARCYLVKGSGMLSKPLSGGATWPDPFFMVNSAREGVII